MLIMITGLPGSGKTTLAKVLVKDLNASHLNIEIIRTRMGERRQKDENLFSKSYAKMLKQTESHLHRGQTIIVEASFYKAALRKPYITLAKKYKKQLFWIWIVADDAIIKERMQEVASYKEEDFEKYLKMKDLYEPLEDRHLKLLSNSSSIKDMELKVKEYLLVKPYPVNSKT